MNELLTISLLLVVVCNLGVLWLYWRIYEWTQTPVEIYETLRLVLSRLSHSADRERKILRRISEVKTRLADEERDDQRDKAAARRKGVRS